MKQNTRKNRKKIAYDPAYFLQGVNKASYLPIDRAGASFLHLVSPQKDWQIGGLLLPDPSGSFYVVLTKSMDREDSTFIRKCLKQVKLDSQRGLVSRLEKKGTACFIKSTGMAKLWVGLESTRNRVSGVFAVPVFVSGRVSAIFLFFSALGKTPDRFHLELISSGALLLGVLLGQQNSQLQMLQNEKMASLGEMAGGIAHEINTPLGAITLSISQLKELFPKEIEHRQLVDEIIGDVLDSAEKISRIVRGLKNFSRDSDGDFVFCDLVLVLKESLSLCEITLKNKRTKLTLGECPTALNIKCNPSQISQVIVNLVNNAKDAVEKINEKWIEISLRELDHTIELRVTDAGRGIPAKVRQKMFQPFFTTKNVGSGTGLGLSIVHGIVLKHKGEVFLDESCKNTSFVVRLPKI